MISVLIGIDQSYSYGGDHGGLHPTTESNIAFAIVVTIIAILLVRAWIRRRRWRRASGMDQREQPPY